MHFLYNQKEKIKGGYHNEYKILSGQDLAGHGRQSDPAKEIWHWGVRCYASCDLYNWEDKEVCSPYVREATAHFIRHYKHYLITSGTTGYNPNPSEVAIADTWHGPYTVQGNPHVNDPTNTSFHSQISSVFKVQGKKDLYIAVADRWRHCVLKVTGSTLTGKMSGHWMNMRMHQSGLDSCIRSVFPFHRCCACIFFKYIAKIGDGGKLQYICQFGDRGIAAL